MQSRGDPSRTVIDRGSRTHPIRSRSDARWNGAAGDCGRAPGSRDLGGKCLLVSEKEKRRDGVGG
jgi:hypothetical protein